MVNKLEHKINRDGFIIKGDIYDHIVDIVSENKVKNTFYLSIDRWLTSAYNVIKNGVRTPGKALGVATDLLINSLIIEQDNDNVDFDFIFEGILDFLEEEYKILFADNVDKGKLLAIAKDMRDTVYVEYPLIEGSKMVFPLDLIPSIDLMFGYTKFTAQLAVV